MSPRPSASMRITRPMSLMIEGWMPSVGSSRTSSLRPGGQRAGDRQLLLLAAGQVAAAPVQHLLQHREQLEQLGGMRVSRRLGGQAHRRFSSTVRRAKISRPCGT